jgi:hypothetical protein
MFMPIPHVTKHASDKEFSQLAKSLQRSFKTNLDGVLTGPLEDPATRTSIGCTATLKVMFCPEELCCGVSLGGTV